MRDIPVIYEDNWLYIVEKPSGFLTIPDPKKKHLSLTEILNQRLKDNNVAWRLHPCHRLDRDTSGLLIYAKGKSIQKKMMDAFKARAVKKTYTAFTQGKISNDHGRIGHPIDGEPALTEYRVLERRADFSIVEVRPLTGRKNQIRIHFKRIGHPIVGEDRFAFRKDFSLRFKRLCLHAQGLEFKHPFTGQNIAIKAPLPRDLSEFLKTHP